MFVFLQHRWESQHWIALWSGRVGLNRFSATSRMMQKLQSSKVQFNCISRYKQMLTQFLCGETNFHNCSVDYGDTASKVSLNGGWLQDRKSFIDNQQKFGLKNCSNFAFASKDVCFFIGSLLEVGDAQEGWKGWQITIWGKRKFGNCSCDLNYDISMTIICIQLNTKLQFNCWKKYFESIHS